MALQLLLSNERGQNVATPAYLDAYAQILNRELLTLKGNPSARVRLNAAIVCALVAQQANNAHLKDAAVMFIQDPSEAVVLWGIKAARWIIPAQLGQVAAQPDLGLVNEIVPAVQKHPKGTIGGAPAYPHSSSKI